MSGMGRRFDPSEVRPDTGPGPSDAELAEAMVAARELEALGARDAAGPTAGFEDRVMAAIAAEPAPRVLARPGRNVRYGLLGAFLISVRDAWRLATGGGRPLAVRAQAMAFVLLVVLATGSLSVFAAVGASSLLSSGPTARPSLPTRTASPSPSPSPSILPSPTPPPASGQTVEPGQTDEPGTSADPTDTTEPGETNEAEPSDETPKTATTPKPTRTPRAAETPEPEETDDAEPTETDDHGGGGGGEDDSSGPGGD